MACCFNNTNTILFQRSEESWKKCECMFSLCPLQLIDIGLFLGGIFYLRVPAGTTCWMSKNSVIYLLYQTLEYSFCPCLANKGYCLLSLATDPLNKLLLANLRP